MKHGSILSVITRFCIIHEIVGSSSWELLLFQIKLHCLLLHDDE
jgi:hypothetical protein